MTNKYTNVHVITGVSNQVRNMTAKAKLTYYDIRVVFSFFLLCNSLHICHLCNNVNEMKLYVFFLFSMLYYRSSK